MKDNRQQNYQRITAEYQRNLDAFVHREVGYCVSTLVYELSQQPDAFPDYYEDLFRAYYGEPDYEAAARQAGWTPYPCDDGSIDAKLDDEIRHYNLPANDFWRELCELEMIDADDYRPEILEHWIVSDWLAAKLSDRGELILSDFFGLTVWGRATTGQAISLDSVICDIYDSTKLPLLDAVAS